MKDYTKKYIYEFNELQDISLIELEKYVKYMNQLGLEDTTNNELFEYINNLYKFWIGKSGNNETAYHMYLDFLNLTNHYYEAYSICKKLLQEEKFFYMVYAQLSDFGYVCDGVISFEEHLDNIRNAIIYCKDKEKKKEWEDLFKYEENLWK